MKQGEIEALVDALYRMTKATEKIAQRWGLVGRIVWAWILTIPVTATRGYQMCRAPFATGWVTVPAG